jgi:hypothetical protein
VAIFLIRSFEERKSIRSAASQSSNSIAATEYDDVEEFNESWDETFGEFTMGEYSYPASLILYHVDNDAYQYEKNLFEETDVAEESV